MQHLHPSFVADPVRDREERGGRRIRIGPVVAGLDGGVTNYRSESSMPVVLTTVLGFVVSGEARSGRG